MGGFISGSVLGGRLPTSRTYVEAVARVIRACGQDAPSSITGTVSNHIARARAAVDDALQRVYNACLWDFRFRQAYLEFTANTFGYRLPADWAARGTNVLQSYLPDVPHTPTTPIEYVDYMRLVSAFPNLKVCINSLQTVDAGLSEAVKLVDAIEAKLGGVPEYFTIIGDYMCFYPIPVANDEHGNPNWDIEQPVLVGYWGVQKDLTENTDAIPLPHNLLDAHHFLSLAYYKQSGEYSDFQADEQRGEALLRIEVAKALQVQGDKQLNSVVEYGGV